jgi:hypothetical protein
MIRETSPRTTGNQQRPPYRCNGQARHQASVARSPCSTAHPPLVILHALNGRDVGPLAAALALVAVTEAADLNEI